MQPGNREVTYRKVCEMWSNDRRQTAPRITETRKPTGNATTIKRSTHPRCSAANDTVRLSRTAQNRFQDRRVHHQAVSTNNISFPQSGEHASINIASRAEQSYHNDRHRTTRRQVNIIASEQMHVIADRSTESSRTVPHRQRMQREHIRQNGITVQEYTKEFPRPYQHMQFIIADRMY
jgi:hypothetical protein